MKVKKEKREDENGDEETVKARTEMEKKAGGQWWRKGRKPTERWIEKWR